LSSVSDAFSSSGSADGLSSAALRGAVVRMHARNKTHTMNFKFKCVVMVSLLSGHHPALSGKLRPLTTPLLIKGELALLASRFRRG
jgi:hypothetical protein